MTTKLTDIQHIQRRKTVGVAVGHVVIGSGHPIVIQSMTNTSTNDIEASVAQCRRIADAGADIVRLTTQGETEARNVGLIKERLRAEGYDVPLVADVHFNPRAAFEASRQIEKVRINPGNFADPARVFKQVNHDENSYSAELARIEERFGEFLDICRENDTAVRLGVNHGSLSDRIMSRYGDTPRGMVESVVEYLEIARKRNFDRIVISIKASNVTVMVETVRLLVKRLDALDMHFPLHLGVTEAGDGEDGRVKSAVGIGTLLCEGLGDTIRVSLSEDPEAEIPVARKLVDYCATAAPLPASFAPVDSRLRLKVVDVKADYPEDCKPDIDDLNALPTEAVFDYGDLLAEDVVIRASVDIGRRLLSGYRGPICIKATRMSPQERVHLAFSILQACRLRMTRTEYISCPSCGRTLFDLQTTLKAVKETTAKYPGLKIGVMGCIVNGPGEMADADYGYVGAGPGRVSVYRGKECVKKNIPAEDALSELIALIEADRQ